jgi:hypothetical protein
MYAFYAPQQRPLAFLVGIGVVAGWALFLVVDQGVGALVLVLSGLGLLGFLGPNGSKPDGAAGADPMNTIGTGSGAPDVGSGPYLGGSDS